MIVKQSDHSANALLVIPEDADDLFTLRRVIAPGDYAIADTTRVVKQESDYGRPDRGERIKVRLTIRVDRIELDASVDRLRISGTITHTSNELVSKGVHHALSVQAGDILTIDKGRKWQDVELKLLKRSGDGSSFILVAIDTQEAAVAKVTGTHVKIIPNIYSGQQGKRYPTKNPSLDSFFADTAKTVGSVLSEGDRIIVFGPGETRRRFYNALDRNGLPKERAQVVDGVDVAGEDGVFVFLRSPAMKDAMSASKLATVSAMLDQVMLMVNRGENKYAVGLKDITEAANIKAIEAIIFSDSVFKTAEEDAVVKLLNSVESYGARTYAVDSSTDIGLRVSLLGGMVALLRYAMR
ncbi:mRNA surveillance protein pelota [Candidatus Nitrososphaera evergladensis SR1]|jgi:protein pelota|uniref:Protein pelota homolog n=1 Tax=Candidatus Nitrososphaera evergladensis SR1 TaxID=1459636 RepID=A0A075MTC9_9ARCH|nr:mRNA surveillance protein pelota [Candidatus Nitrososphaera evergladensis]AIF84368.1 mRNA surveillance protein pelota [Candidatus Nitrososphaera evergladensis SR1]